jgi:hypothetical protein
MEAPLTVVETGQEVDVPSKLDCCRGCGQFRSISRPRGLCWSCYYSADVRSRFPPRAPLGIGVRGTKLPEQPTSALPGSPEKVQVLCERCERGEILWHPLDAVIQG